MAYRDNWLRHFFAGVTGNGGSRELARDFCSGEDIWNPTMPVQHRWLKIIWVSFASNLAQLTLPLLLMFGLSVVIMGPISLDFVLLIASSITAIGTIGLVFIEVLNYAFAKRRLALDLNSISPAQDTTCSTTSASQPAERLPDVDDTLPTSPRTSRMVDTPDTNKLDLGSASMAISDGKATLTVKREK